ncbi:ribonuclease H-like domain-containing protein, partial [Tanacetum coccineum]
SVPEYYHKLNSLWREFDTLTLLPACTCAAHESVLKHNQLIRLMQFLMRLNDVYQNIRSNIVARDPLPDVKEAFNVVSREESHRGLHLGIGSGFGNKVQPAAFVVKSNNFRGNEPRRGGNSFGNSNGKVYNNNTEAPKGASTSFGSTSFDTQFTKEQMMKILSLINGKPSGNAMRPTFLNGNALFNMHFEKFFCAQTFFNLTVGHPNGTLAKISAIGSLRLTANVVLFDVLVIPDYNDLNLVKTLRTGSEADGLYLFDVDQIGKSIVGCANSTFVCHVSKQLWHNRLGHPADHVLSVLSKSIGLKYEKHVSPCDICHKA